MKDINQINPLINPLTYGDTVIDNGNGKQYGIFSILNGYAVRLIRDNDENKNELLADIPNDQMALCRFFDSINSVNN